MWAQWLVYLAKAEVMSPVIGQTNTRATVGLALFFVMLGRLGPRHLIDRSHDDADGILTIQNCIYATCVVAKLCAVWSVFQLWRRLWLKNAK